MPTASVNGVEIYYEETGLFNLHLAEFLTAVEAGRWAGWVR